jgi:cyclopropane-fatty-acyl-phospholipid synthase
MAINSQKPPGPQALAADGRQRIAARDAPARDNARSGVGSLGSRLEDLLVENYLSGRLPLPDPLLTALQNFGVECYYRFGRRLDRMPRQWAGDQGEITPGGGTELMSVHYDLPAGVFERFLGRTMKYSMAYWERGAANLDDAQEAMMADLCRKMDLRDGMSVLDVGCGFGSFASFVLQRYPRCSVFGLTLSDTQFRYMVDKQAQPGHPLNGGRFRVAREDFGTWSSGERFDRVVSIGVFEHLSNLKLALARMRTLVKDDGACLLHYIVYTELVERFADYDMSRTFMRRYIFPHSRFWHDRELFEYQDDFRIDRYWFLNGSNYLRTLKAWQRNFRSNWDAIRAIRGDDERFYRIWNYYFGFTGALFRGRGGRQVGNGQYLLRPR